MSLVDERFVDCCEQLAKNRPEGCWVQLSGRFSFYIIRNINSDGLRHGGRRYRLLGRLATLHLLQDLHECRRGGRPFRPQITCIILCSLYVIYTYLSSYFANFQSLSLRW